MIGQTGAVRTLAGRGRGLIKPIVAPHIFRPSFRWALARTPLRTGAQPRDLRETDKIAEVKDQGGDGSCNGHASMGATDSQFALNGDPLGFVSSEDTAYRGALTVDRHRQYPSTPVDQLPRLQDVGSQTEDVLAWMSVEGVCARREPQTSDGRNSDCESPFSGDNVAFGASEDAAVLLVTGPYVIDPTASDAEDLVQAALSSGIVVRVDAFVDTAFENWTKGSAPIAAPDVSDPNGGGHAIYCVGWATVNGSPVYIIRNSWSESWGDGGDCLVSSAWLKSAWALYPWTVRRAAPAKRAA